MNGENYYWVIVVVILGLLFYPVKLCAQEENLNEKFYQNLNISYLVGGQIHNNNFLYNPGYSLKFSYGKKVNSDISIGLGTGYMSLTNENFLNHFVEIIAKKKGGNNTPFINFQGGYSIGWFNSSHSSQYYKMNGGIVINAGLGRMIKVNEKYALLFHWSYCHQFAKIEYENFDENNYSEMLNYDMLQISIGVLFDWK